MAINWPAQSVPSAEKCWKLALHAQIELAGIADMRTMDSNDMQEVVSVLIHLSQCSNYTLTEMSVEH